PGGRRGRLRVRGGRSGRRGRRGLRGVVAGRVEGVHGIAVGGAGRGGGVAVGQRRAAHRRDLDAAPEDGVAGHPHVVGRGRPGQVYLGRAGRGGAEARGRRGGLRVGRPVGPEDGRHGVPAHGAPEGEAGVLRAGGAGEDVLPGIAALLAPKLEG